MNVFILLFLLLIIIILALLLSTVENFTVPFHDYKKPYWGYCTPNLSPQEFASGKYQTQCWSNFSSDDCIDLMSNGFNCGYNVETGQPIPCNHSFGNCKDNPLCFSTCYTQTDIWKQPYMIKVTRQDLIALSPL